MYGFAKALRLDEAKASTGTSRKEDGLKPMEINGLMKVSKELMTSLLGHEYLI